ncbi:MAG: flagellar biosynthesis anti-sigma factor FlgM [Pirellulales bacterium]|jgi:anti-sigma28 factor (negative regulator of flagellin synthesis)
MNISGVSSTHGSASVNSVQGIEATESTAKTQSEGLTEVHDNISLSVDAVQAAETVGDVRLDRVNSIRAAIADGSYETPEKLDVAIDRLLDRLS